MQRFAFQSARSVAEAATLASRTVAAAMLSDPALAAATDCVVLKAGGIDLLGLMKEGLLRPARLVNLRGIPGLDTIAEDGDGMRIGALVTLEQLAAHPWCGRATRRWLTPLRARPVRRSATWRRSAATCCNGRAAGISVPPRIAARARAATAASPLPARTSTTRCSAKTGCAMVHPSTAATALAAFDARIELVDAKGATRSVPLEEFVVGPEIDITRETDLRAGEMLTAVLLPPLPASACSVFLKQGEKSARLVDRRCRRGAGLRIGRTLPTGRDRAGCRRAGSLARAAGRGRADRTEDRPAVAQAAGQAAIAGAVALPHNAYKLPILATLARRAVLQARDPLAAQPIWRLCDDNTPPKSAWDCLPRRASSMAPRRACRRRSLHRLPCRRRAPISACSLAQALKLRCSTRDFAPRALPPQVLSELLWSAYGVNRPATADRTAPSFRHARETEIFAATADGCVALRSDRAPAGAASRHGRARRRPACSPSLPPRRSNWSMSPMQSI